MTQKNMLLEPTVILATRGGSLCIPRYCMIGRADGGNLLVMPPRDVWDRSELTADELTQWSFLIAAAARAMLETLPQLKDGVINYWEAGNWSLAEAAPPAGPKVGPRHKKVHMHLIGRSPKATDPDWTWGEAPVYPTYADSGAWMDGKERVTAEEGHLIATRAAAILQEKYSLNARDITQPAVIRA